MRWFSQPPEQRRFPRFKTDLRTTANLIRERDIISIHSRCETISEGGIGARGRGFQCLAVGDLVSLELDIPICTHTIWVNSVVRYVVARRNRARCGLQFLSLTDSQRTIIQRYCHFLPVQKRSWWH